ncbi:MAG: NDP-sugar synthase [Acidobacteria bacterium]|nr:NDP-sugar synthase [Acidobacteriota bacterium]
MIGAARGLVLTAGVGSRLRPLTYARAKAALPVAGEPLVRRILRWLAEHDICDLVLNLHHKPDTITCLVGDGSDLDIRVRYSWEPRVLGSAGGPRRALDLLDAPHFFIVNGDTLTDLDPRRVLDEHVASGAQVTMALIPNAEPGKYGGVVVDGDGWIERFTAPGPGARTYHFIGVQVANREVFEPLVDGERMESVTGVYRKLIASNKRAVRAQVSSASFMDIGTAADYWNTSLHLARAEGTGDRSLRGRGVEVDATARLTRTIVWDDVSVGADCELVDCIVADGVSVPAGTRLASTAIVRANDGAPQTGEERLGDLLVKRFHTAQ